MGAMAATNVRNNKFKIFFASSTLVCIWLVYLIYRGPTVPTRESLVPSFTLKNPLDYYNDNNKNHLAPADDNEDVAFCIAIRNQADDLPEFLIHHYHHHGIRRFYIMDDVSDPPLSTFQDFGIPRSAMSFQHFDQKAHDVYPKGMQLHSYRECMRLYGSVHKWIAFIDTDEFIETPVPGENLQTILKELEHNETVGALNINWRIHSSGGVLTRPDSVRKAFTKCIADPTGGKTLWWKDNRLTKAVVKTALYNKPVTPHYYKTLNGSISVGENGDKINTTEGVRWPITRDRIALHHYTLKSKQQFEEKLEIWQDKDWSYWHHIEKQEQVECPELAEYNP